MLIYGVFDFAEVGGPMFASTLHDAYLGRVASAGLLEDPRVSPIHGAESLPPTLIIVGGTGRVARRFACTAAANHPRHAARVRLMAHLLSLAAGVLPEFPPDQIVRAAAEAGYRATGVWCDMETWTDATTRAVRQQLRDGALHALDIEVIWIQPGREISDNARRLIDVGGTLGVRNVLIVSSNPSLDDTKRQFAALCEHAAAAGMRAVLEFLMIAQLRTLAQAVDVVTDVGHPAGGVLVDALHLARCGATATDVAAVARDRLPYAQLCDGPASLANPDSDAYLADAIDGRCAAGEGQLPLRELLAALPNDVPLSLEVRSRRYREAYPDPVDRARAVLTATRDFLASS